MSLPPLSPSRSSLQWCPEREMSSPRTLCHPSSLHSYLFHPWIIGGSIARSTVAVQNACWLSALWLALRGNRELLAGVCLGVACYIDLFPLYLLPAFAVMGNGRKVCTCAHVCVCVCVCVYACRLSVCVQSINNCTPSSRALSLTQSPISYCLIH
jgi:GPI transamidase subunit PIG-U